jgi:hypothetical protein
MTTLLPMKSTPAAFALALILLTGCATTMEPEKAEPKISSGSEKSPDSETVLIAYRVKAGDEAEFEQVLARAWKIYRQNNLVFAQPHLIVRDKEAGGKTVFMEIFTWVSHDAADHAPDSVKQVWDKMQSLCEKRDGHGGLEGGEVEIVPQSQ